LPNLTHVQRSTLTTLAEKSQPYVTRVGTSQSRFRMGGHVAGMAEFSLQWRSSQKSCTYLHNGVNRQRSHQTVESGGFFFRRHITRVYVIYSLIAVVKIEQLGREVAN
jgi:hypothetical protein